MRQVVSPSPSMGEGRVRVRDTVPDERTRSQLKFKESLVSAHHNYLVNQMLSPGFVLGNPDSKDDFYFLADVVRPGESEPKIYSRLYDAQGNFILETEPKRILENPLGCLRQPFPGGYRIVLPSGSPFSVFKPRALPTGISPASREAARSGRKTPNGALLRCYPNSW